MSDFEHGGQPHHLPDDHHAARTGQRTPSAAGRPSALHDDRAGP